MKREQNSAVEELCQVDCDDGQENVVRMDRRGEIHREREKKPVSVNRWSMQPDRQMKNIYS